MKPLLFAIALLTSVSQAAQLHNAVYNPLTDKVDVDLTYGGCGLDTFKVTFNNTCLETFPMQTSAVLDDSQDNCRALIRTKLSIDLDGMAACRPARLGLSTLRGAGGVSVMVPEKTNPVADMVKVGRDAHPVKVNEVIVRRVGERGFPSQHVFITSTFSNKCVAPKSSELIKIAQHTDQYNNLILTVGSDSRRICPMVYQPVTITIDLGVYTKPNDGLFQQITVNGVDAN